jgi:hypothetical protein
MVRPSVRFGEVKGKTKKEAQSADYADKRRCGDAHRQHDYHSVGKLCIASSLLFHLWKSATSVDELLFLAAVTLGNTSTPSEPPGAIHAGIDQQCLRPHKAPDRRWAHARTA